MKMFSKDVFLNFAGGFKVADPGLDLAVTAAVISSYYDRPIGEGICLAGEIGLSGEVRPAPYGTAYQRSCPARVQTDRRIGLPGPFENPKVSKSSRSTASTNSRVPCSRKDRLNSRYLLKTCTRSPDELSSGHYFWYFYRKEESFEKQMRDLSFEKDSKIGKNKKYRLNMKDFDKIIGRNAITMIYFFTSRCVPCEAMEPALDQFERRMAGRVDIYRINTDADENAYLLYRYMIRTTPTLIYFRKGDEIRRCEGPLTYQELLELQEQVETVEHVCLN